jgi:preprotein translocase subunit SecF
MYDLVSKRFWLFLISGIIILIGIVAMLTPFGRLQMATEFTSGTQLRIGFEETVSQSELREALAEIGYSDVIIRSEIVVTGEQGDFIIRTERLESEEEKTALVTGLAEKLGAAEVKGLQNVSPEVAKETVQATIIAIVVASVFILLYIVWAFRSMPHPFRYGTCAIIALVHDVIVSVGIFAIMGAFFGWEVDLMFITGILTIIGFSCDNSVVIFDRIRDTLKSGISSNFDVVVNTSVIGALGRCINMSLMVVIVMLALMIFVGATIQNFVVIMLIGAIVGTFDAVCVAPMLLVVWENKEWGRFIPFRAGG